MSVGNLIVYFLYKGVKPKIAAIDVLSKRIWKDFVIQIIPTTFPSEGIIVEPGKVSKSQCQMIFSLSGKIGYAIARLILISASASVACGHAKLSLTNPGPPKAEPSASPTPAFSKNFPGSFTSAPRVSIHAK